MDINIREILSRHIKESHNRIFNQPSDKELHEAELGDFLYLVMGNCDGHKVVMGVGYTPEYADKKAKQFEIASGGLCIYEDISVICNGEKKKCRTLKRF